MSSSIHGRLKRRSSTVDTLTSSFVPPRKSRVNQTTSPIIILPPHSEGGNVVYKTSSKDTIALIPISGMTQSTCLREQVDSATLYFKELTKHVQDDFVIELDVYILNELANSFQRSAC